MTIQYGKCEICGGIVKNNGDVTHLLRDHIRRKHTEEEYHFFFKKEAEIEKKIDELIKEKTRLRAENYSFLSKSQFEELPSPLHFILNLGGSKYNQCDEE